MTDYTKLVEALRLETDYVAVEKTMRDAADAIEALQAEQKKTVTQIFGEEQQEWEEYCTGLMNRIKELKAQLPKRGKWVMMRQSNGGHYKGCSVCHAPMPTDTMLDYLDDADCKWCYSCGAKMTEVQDG